MGAGLPPVTGGFSRDFVNRTPAPRRPPPRPKKVEYEYDVFVSYSRKDKGAAGYLAKCLEGAKLRVFIDKVDIEPGASWQQKIFDALDSCNLTAVLYSPDFIKSEYCKDEFNIAYLRRKKQNRNVLFPLLLRKADLPTYMEALNYVDCRISDKAKIKAAAKQLIASLSPKGKGKSATARK